MHKAKPLPVFLEKKPIRKAEKDSAADLKSRFLELQLLRQKVRIAECGRRARALDGSNYEVQYSRAEPSKHSLSAND